MFEKPEALNFNAKNINFEIWNKKNTAVLNPKTSKFGLQTFSTPLAHKQSYRFEVLFAAWFIFGIVLAVGSLKSVSTKLEV